MKRLRLRPVVKIDLIGAGSKSSIPRTRFPWLIAMVFGGRGVVNWLQDADWPVPLK
jgi:hypothetical protein